MGASMNKEVEKIVRELRKRGCEVRQTGSGHWRVTREGWQAITIAKTPSTYRTMLNIRADVKRYLGIELPSGR